MPTTGPRDIHANRRCMLATAIGSALVLLTCPVMTTASASPRPETVVTADRTGAAALRANLSGTAGRLSVRTAAGSTTTTTTVVRDEQGVLATFTKGARTVTLRGPSRTFSEETTTATVTTTSWVRLLPQPFTGKVDKTWLEAALRDRSPDVLAVALQYTTGAPEILTASGSRLAGDASYGPLTDTGRQEGSDFSDYLGVSWSYGPSVDRPESAQLGSLDCSGYVRMVLGYRGGAPLAQSPDGVGLPRRSFQLLASAPGAVLQPDTGSRPPLPVGLAAGDLLFFDAATDDGTQIDHVGIYLGVDSAGAARFLSSRKTVDGPTMGDVGGRSTLTGTGLYATSFRAVRRV